jgi:hypothetical protein
VIYPLLALIVARSPVAKVLPWCSAVVRFPDRTGGGVGLYELSRRRDWP